MKKLLTLAIGLMMANFSVNAQNCDFTYTADASTGNYTFFAPSNFSPLLYSFYWSFENGTVYENGINPSHTYANNMADNVTLNVHQNSPDSILICSSTMQIIILVDSSGTENCFIEYTPTISLPYTFGFIVPGATGQVFWDFGDNTGSNELNPIHTFSGSGTWLVCAEVVQGGITCYTCIDVYIAEDSTINNDPCNSTFYASTSALTGYYIPTGYNNSVSTNYSWSFGDGGTSTEIYPYHVYNQSGFYDVCLSVSNALGCLNTSCKTVFIPSNNPFPQDSSCFAGFVISQENPFEVNIVNITTGNDLTFSWTVSSSFISVTGTGPYPTIQVSETGSFLVCVTVSNSAGCSATFCDSLFVDENGNIGGKVSAAGFTINVLSPQLITGYTTMGMNESELENVSFYPNPFNDVLNISSSSSDLKGYEIISIEGKKVQQGAILGKSQTVNTSDLGKGIYLLNVIDKAGNQKVQKIVKN